MAQQELRPAWCGSLPNAFTTPKPGFLYWSEDRGWLVFCCQECLCAVRRVGWHQKPAAFTGIDLGEHLVHLDRADLDKERSESRDERNRLARKVNALLGKLSEERYMAAHLLAGERETADHLQHQRDTLTTENESLRQALEDLGQKNDGLVMQVAELSGDLEQVRQERDEDKASDYLKYNSREIELLERIAHHHRAHAILEGFVFEVLDQYAESQQQLASNR